MYTDWYEKISEPMREPILTSLLRFLDKVATYLPAIAYVVACVWLFTSGDGRFWRVCLVPAITFGATTALRAFLNEPRPYDRYRIDPILKKDTHGKSLPSRHVASAFAIGAALMWLWPQAGALGFSCCVALCFTRIMGGVHFPRDIVAALALAAAISVVGFVLIT